jgi:hypothetical protein
MQCVTVSFDLVQPGASDFYWHASGEALRWQVQADTVESVTDLGDTVPLAVRQSKTKKELAARIRKVSPQSIGQKFHMTQKQAAYEFGLSLTTFKKTCCFHVPPRTLQARSSFAHSHFNTFSLRAQPTWGKCPLHSAAPCRWAEVSASRGFVLPSHCRCCGVFRVSRNGLGASSSDWTTNLRLWKAARYSKRVRLTSPITTYRVYMIRSTD